MHLCTVLSGKKIRKKVSKGKEMIFEVDQKESKGIRRTDLGETRPVNDQSRCSKLVELQPDHGILEGSLGWKSGEEVWSRSLRRKNHVVES